MIKKYPSDLSEAEFSEIKELIPKAIKGGRARSVDIKKVLDGIFYILKSGCQWRMLPKDFHHGEQYIIITEGGKEKERITKYNLYKKIRAQANKESPYIDYG